MENVNTNSGCTLSQNIEINDAERKISFWYYMYGFKIGALELQKIDTYNNKSVLWSMKGRQEKEWLYATVDLPEGEYKVKLCL